MTKIFLDDIRLPPSEDWIVVRGHFGFNSAIFSLSQEDWGNGVTISFDHDLGWDDVLGELPDGYHCMKMLCKHLEKNSAINLDKIEILVHSANPVGAENIRAYWKSYKKSREQT